MANYDLPAGFAYIANYTGFEKIDYIGHSQGSTSMFIALATRNPGVLKHVNKIAAFGPVFISINSISISNQNSRCFLLFLQR